jgi:hypothetical protein
METSLSHAYLKNVWYRARWSYELDAGPLCRTILGSYFYETESCHQ